MSRRVQCTHAGSILLMLSPLRLHEPCASMRGVLDEDEPSDASGLSLEVDDRKEAVTLTEQGGTIARISKGRASSVHRITC